MPLEEIREDIAQTITAEKQQKDYNDLVTGLRESAKIKRYPLDDSK